MALPNKPRGEIAAVVDPEVVEHSCDVLIVGGGISGTALFYELAKYTNVQSLCLLEKYEALATLNSKGTSNSQTIHTGR